MSRPMLFGKYCLLERLSVGGMAEVFKAKSYNEAGFEKIVALKAAPAKERKTLAWQAKDIALLEKQVSPEEANVGAKSKVKPKPNVMQAGQGDTAKSKPKRWTW